MVSVLVILVLVIIVWLLCVLVLVSCWCRYSSSIELMKVSGEVCSSIGVLMFLVLVWWVNVMLLLWLSISFRNRLVSDEWMVVLLWISVGYSLVWCSWLMLGLISSWYSVWCVFSGRCLVLLR